MHFLEYGVIRKKAENRVALVYPNVYRAGNSNLGFLFVYNLINEQENFQCERFFTDFQKSVETNSVLEDFDVIAFSCSFEMDYFTVYEIAKKYPHKIKILGGRTSYNPFPLKGVIDYFFVGDAEESLPEFCHSYEEGGDLSIEGVFKGERTKARHSPLEYHPVCEPIQWGEYPEAFTRSFLLEISRGCSRKCKFCLVSHCIGRKRERSLERIEEIVAEAEKRTKFETIVLIGPDSHSHLLDIVEICRPYRVSLPSLRVEEISEELLRSVNPETVTIAPETSERLRFDLGKRIKDTDIVEKTKTCSCYARWMKLYFMVGLPGETEEDLDSIVSLTKSVSKVMRTKVTVSPFVPKSHTPYSDLEYDTKAVEKALTHLRKRMRFSGPTAREGFVQWVLSSGDEQASTYLETRRWKSERPTFTQKWKLIEV